MGETDLEKAIKLLKECYWQVNSGCQINNDKLYMIPDNNLRNKIAEFVNKNDGRETFKVIETTSVNHIY